jgi:hypothetical protein
MSKTISKLLFEDVRYVDAIEAVVIYRLDVVLLIKEFTFVTIVGIEPVPFSTISSTISNPVATFTFSEVAGVIDDVICVPPKTFTPLFVFLTIVVGIEPVPFDKILSMLPNEDDTINLSDVVTDIDDVVC